MLPSPHFFISFIPYFFAGAACAAGAAAAGAFFSSGLLSLLLLSLLLFFSTELATILAVFFCIFNELLCRLLLISAFLHC